MDAVYHRVQCQVSDQVVYSMLLLDSGAVDLYSAEWQSTLLCLAVWWMSLSLAHARGTLPVWLCHANSRVWWRRDNTVGLFFRGWPRPLSSSKVWEILTEFLMLQDTNIHFGQFYDSNYLRIVWGKSCSSMTEPQCTKQGSWLGEEDLNPHIIQTLWGVMYVSIFLSI